jgi:hypothetical protein
MSVSILPFSLQLPAGYSFTTNSSGAQDTPVSSTTPASADATSTTSANSSEPVDVVSISNALVAGDFTAQGGDSFRMSELFQASASTGQTIAGYRVALGNGGGQLKLGSTIVTGQTDFTADQFRQLTYTAGTGGSQSLTVIAQTGTRQPNLPDGTLGALSGEIDSPAVQIIANVTGTRSINAMNALSTQLTATDPDANIVSIAQQAGIFTGWSGAAQPTLQTDGNLTAQGGDSYRMSGLFQASASTGQTIAGYRVALGDGGGKLMLGTQDVTGQTDFTADQFRQLTYVAGTGGSQSLTVIAQTGTRQPNLPDGSLGALSREIDSPAVQITANVTGTRSINAMNALSTQLAVTDPDANIVSIAQQAGIFTGWSGAALPTLQTDGNFSVQGGDSYRMSGLFQASASTGQTIAGYRVALGDGGGKLMLGTPDVTGQTDFTADQFRQLTYVAGTGGSQSLTVIAQTGTRQPNLPDGTLGALSGEIDSPAVQITANVTGTRSINAMNALSTQLAATDPDANIVSIAQQAGIFTGWSGAAQPTLRTDGNFTVQAGDSYRMSGLFQASASTGQTIAGYRVALGDGGGKLMLGTKDVTGQTDFTADQFRQLTYVAGTGGSQSLTVIAQTGTRQPNLPDGSLGVLSREIDSPAVQIAASVTGTRSINAMNALSTQLAATDPDANIVSIAQQSGIFTGWSGATRPTLRTDGNFTAQANDSYRMSALFGASASAGQTIAGYRVALGDGGGAGGKLMLGSTDVTGQTDFTADQFRQLTYVAGTGGSQSLTVIAQTGTRQPNLPDGSLGALSREIDSPAVQITANVTGARSINAMNALSTQLAATDPDANIVSIAQQAGIFTGWSGTAQPTLQTALTPEPPVSLAALEESVGAYQSAGSDTSQPTTDLSSFYPTAIASAESPGSFTSPGGPKAIALLLLDGAVVGAFQTVDDLAPQAQAIRAYSATKTL